jgi:hypothetical protein
VLRICELLAEKSIIKIDHLPYTPDLALCKIKKGQGHRFADIPDT